MFSTKDMERQSDILNHVSKLLDEGILKSTVTTVFTAFFVKNVKKSHQLQESGKSIGKTVIEY